MLAALNRFIEHSALIMKLAIRGGTATIPSALPGFDWPPREGGWMSREVSRYLDSGAPLSEQGRDGVIAEVEDRLGAVFSRRHALFTSSGTSALFSAGFALGLRPGDEVICPTVTFHATASPLLFLGVKVILCDVRPETGNICPDSLEAAVTKRTKAVFTNAMWGHPIDQESVGQVCERHGIAWVEDCSHAQFSRYQGRPVGSFGHIACSSLQGQKFISGGEAGVLATDDLELYHRAVMCGNSLRRTSQIATENPSWSPLARTGFGLKLRGHVLAAALVNAQLRDHATTWLRERRDSLMRFRGSLSEIAGVEPRPILSGVDMGAWYGFKVNLRPAAFGLPDDLHSVGLLVEALRAEGVEVAGVGSPPLHELPLFHDPAIRILDFPKAAAASEYPGAAAYRRNLVSLEPYSGERHEARMQATLAAFAKISEHQKELRHVVR